MRLVVEATENGGETAAILAGWRAEWGAEETGSEIQIADCVSLSALLDLRQRCYDRSMTLNLYFPDNQ
jgi:hypothetical protein